MIWNKTDIKLKDHFKTKELMLDMGWSLPETLGKLQLLWGWCAEHAPTGLLTRHSSERIADVMEVPRADAKKLLKFLKKNNFIDKNPLRIHDWPDYHGAFLQKNRPAIYRQMKAIYSNRPVSGRKPRKNRALDIEIDIDKRKIIKEKFSVLIPPELKGLETLILDWIVHKHELKKPCAPTSLKYLWIRILEIPPERREKALKDSLEGEWTRIIDIAENKPQSDRNSAESQADRKARYKEGLIKAGKCTRITMEHNGTPIYCGATLEPISRICPKCPESRISLPHLKTIEEVLAEK